MLRSSGSMSSIDLELRELFAEHAKTMEVRWADVRSDLILGEDINGAKLQLLQLDCNDLINAILTKLGKKVEA